MDQNEEQSCNFRTVAVYLSGILFQSISLLMIYVGTYFYKDKLEPVIQYVFFISVIVSSTFLTSFVKTTVGFTGIWLLSLTGYLIWITFHAYATIELMVLAFVIYGLSYGLIWPVLFSNLSMHGKRYSVVSKITEESGINITFGVYFTLSRFGWIIVLLFYMTDVDKYASSYDIKMPYKFNNSCNIQDTNSSQVNNSLHERQIPSKFHSWLAYIICIIVILISFLTLVICKLKNNLPDFEKQTHILHSLYFMVDTIKHLRKKKQLVIIPLTVYAGCIQYWCIFVFMKSFIASNSGSVPIVIIFPFWFLSTLIALIGGYAVGYTGRLPLYIMAFIIDLIVYISFLAWQPIPYEWYIFYVVPSLMGMSVGIWMTQIISLYGVTFRDHLIPVYSNYVIWETVGFLITFIINHQSVCINIQIYLLITLLLIGFIGYACVEYEINLYLNFMRGNQFIKCCNSHKITKESATSNNPVEISSIQTSYI